MTGAPRRVVLECLGEPGDRDAARVITSDGNTLAVIAEPAASPARDALRDEAIRAALEEDFGEVILAGVAFAREWGGDAVAFT